MNFATKGSSRYKTNFSLGDVLLICVLLASTGCLFFPAFLWVVEAARLHGQLAHTLAVALFLFLSAWRRDPEMPSQPDSDLDWKGSLRRLGAAFAFVTVAILIKQPLLVFLGAGFATAAWLRLLTRRARLSDSTGAVIFCLFLSALVVRGLDWPLRVLAGQLSLESLRILGFVSELALRTGGGIPPAILLKVNGRFYEVAAECNGFGLLTGCLITAIFFCVYWRVGILTTILIPALALICGIIFNALRITAICAVAPNFESHYNEVHEIIGVLMFWVALFVVYKLCRCLRKRHKNLNLANGSGNAMNKVCQF